MGTALPFAVGRRADRTLLGWVGVTRGTAAAAAFRLLDLEVVGAAAQPGDAASFGVPRGCGMVPVGERAVLAPARGRREPCLLREVARPTR